MMRGPEIAIVDVNDVVVRGVGVGVVVNLVVDVKDVTCCGKCKFVVVVLLTLLSLLSLLLLSTVGSVIVLLLQGCDKYLPPITYFPPPTFLLVR